MVSAVAYVLSPEIVPAAPGETRRTSGGTSSRSLGDRSPLGLRHGRISKDLGTPDRYDRVKGDWECGKILRWHRRNPRPAVFLDRDGVSTVRSTGSAAPTARTDPGDPRGDPPAEPVEYLSIVVTNQPMLAKGQATWSDLDAVHRKRETLLGDDTLARRDPRLPASSGGRLRGRSPRVEDRMRLPQAPRGPRHGGGRGV